MMTSRTSTSVINKVNSRLTGPQFLFEISGGRLKSFFCGKGLFLCITILLTAFFILLITGVMKSSKTGEAMEEFQSQVQMELSQAMDNVSKKSELKYLELRIQENMNQMSSQLQTQMSTEIRNLLSQISIKLEMLPEPECHSGPCPRHWINFNGSCYFFSTKQATWEDSRKYCSTRGARLLIVNDEAEQHFVTVETESRRFWIGLTDRNSNNVWHWVDDTPYNSTPTPDEGSWPKTSTVYSFPQMLPDLLSSSSILRLLQRSLLWSPTLMV
ncbi:asialoglycoprotein receptor 2-like isoform X2 [Mobula hypostoma]|uniref:asialoglycoprotein receptor 2-like isoform X2 n=1 Tax=Mobula hypostoma TaxID=723540 RepID=UPI002FC3C89D